MCFQKGSDLCMLFSSSAYMGSSQFMLLEEVWKIHLQLKLRKYFKDWLATLTFLTDNKLPEYFLLNSRHRKNSFFWHSFAFISNIAVVLQQSHRKRVAKIL